MSMLPRLKPQCFYDLVIEVAIVRPGPIQGDMVHPYLRRRDGIEKEHYPSPAPAHGPANELKEVLKRTLGVPLFQEQAMQIAITAAKFTARRGRRAAPRHGHVPPHRQCPSVPRQVHQAAWPRAATTAIFAEHCFGQIEGFGEYGFPESHAASFALLVYASAWIKCRYPDVFCAAILNSQPMGFYQPAQLVRDARAARRRDPRRRRQFQRLGLHAGAGPMAHAVRLGFRLIAGLAEDELKKLIAARGNGFSSIERLAAIAGVSRFTIERLAEADAFRSLGLDRRAALWAARRLDMIGIRPPRGGTQAERALPLLTPHLGDELFPEQTVALPAMALGEHVVEDYVATGLSLKEHPVRFFRDRLTALGAVRNAALRSDDLTQDRRRHRRRPRPGAAAAGHVERRRVHDARGRDRHRQHHRLAESLCKKPPHRDDGAVSRRARPPATRRPRHPCGRRKLSSIFPPNCHVTRHRLREGGDLFAPKLSGGPIAFADDAALPLKSRDFH